MNTMFLSHDHQDRNKDYPFSDITMCWRKWNITVASLGIIVSVPTSLISYTLIVSYQLFYYPPCITVIWKNVIVQAANILVKYL